MNSYLSRLDRRYVMAERWLAEAFRLNKILLTGLFDRRTTGRLHIEGDICVVLRCVDVLS